MFRARIFAANFPNDTFLPTSEQPESCPVLADRGHFSPIMRANRLNPNDIFIRRIQNSLLHSGIAGWRRRGKTLLDINCGDGRFLKSLWHAGFDVSATELNFRLRTQAAQSMGRHAEIYAAQDSDLPFENAAFDWVVLHLRYEDDKDCLEDALKEAVRVAGHGLCVTFWNSASPACFLQKGLATSLGSFGWWRVRSCLRHLAGGRVSTQSTLLFALSPLRRLWPRLYFSTVKTRLPLGLWTVIRLDMSPRSTLTPLILPTRFRKMPDLEPVLQCKCPSKS